jgi:hypothetical protein
MLATNQLGCVVSKNGFAKSAILYAENESQIILASEDDICSKIRDYYYKNKTSQKSQEFSNLDISLDNEEFNLNNCFSISGRGKSTVKIGKVIFYNK